MAILFINIPINVGSTMNTFGTIDMQQRTIYIKGPNGITSGYMNFEDRRWIIENDKNNFGIAKQLIEMEKEWHGDNPEYIISPPLSILIINDETEITQ